jgi:hypothetical protein
MCTSASHSVQARKAPSISHQMPFDRRDRAQHSRVIRLDEAQCWQQREARVQIRLTVRGDERVVLRIESTRKNICADGLADCAPLVDGAL